MRRSPKRSGATVAGEHFVADQEHVVLLRELAQRLQEIGRVEAHTHGALRDRLDDDGRQLVRVLLEQASQYLEGLRVALRAGRHAQAVDQHAPELATEQIDARDRRRGHRVTVVGAVESQEACALGPAICPQYCSANLSATSTAVEPSSLKNTRERPLGAT